MILGGNPLVATRVQRAVMDDIREQGIAEGCDVRDVNAIFDVCIDYDYARAGWRVVVEANRSKEDRTRFATFVDDSLMECIVNNEIDPPASRAYLGVLSVEGEIARAKLATYFPRAIKRIERSESLATMQRNVKIVFNNGHSYVCAVEELFSSYSLATMGMLYDLPKMDNADDA
jgi:hypothetical protein